MHEFIPNDVMVNKISCQVVHDVLRQKLAEYFYFFSKMLNRCMIRQNVNVNIDTLQKHQSIVTLCFNYIDFKIDGLPLNLLPCLQQRAMTDIT